MSCRHGASWPTTPAAATPTPTACVSSMPWNPGKSLPAASVGFRTAVPGPAVAGRLFPQLPCLDSPAGGRAGGAAGHSVKAIAAVRTLPGPAMSDWRTYTDLKADALAQTPTRTRKPSVKQDLLEVYGLLPSSEYDYSRARGRGKAALPVMATYSAGLR